MSVFFSADEVLEIAEQIERTGSRFYRRASQGFADANARELFLDLAIMEDEHQKVFAAMRADLSPQEREPVVPDPYAEAVLYLRETADGELFDVMADPSKRLTGKETMQEILRMSIALEKDSMVFYLGIKEMVPERLGKDRIDGIIKEEKHHIAMLTKELAALKG